MKIYESATKLASDIKDSKEYKAFQKSMKELKLDKDSENLLKEYKLGQMEIQSYKIKNRKIDKKTMRKIQSLEDRIKNNEKVYNYLIDEQNFMNMMNTINIILGETVQEDYK